MKNQEKGYEVFFDWDESFDDTGLTITRIDEDGGNPGSATIIKLSRNEAKELCRYLDGCLLYRKRPDGVD